MTARLPRGVVGADPAPGDAAALAAETTRLPRGVVTAGWWLLLLLVALDIAAPVLVASLEPPILLHHVEHSLLTAAGGVIGLRRARRRPVPDAAPNPAWLVAALLLGGLSIVAMAPDLYGYVDSHPLAHSGLHLVFLADGILATYAAERYSRGFGTVWLTLIVTMAGIAATGFGAPSRG